MIIVYSLIIVVTFSIFSYMILDNYRKNKIKDEETTLFQMANIVADTYKRNIDDIIFTRIMVKTYAHQSNARILIINEKNEVIIDSYNSYIGKKLSNTEIKNSLNGKSSSEVYTTDHGEVLQLAVPINLNTGTENKIIGSVLISKSLIYIHKELTNLKKDLIKISIVSLSLAILLTWISAAGITKSLKKVTKAVEELSLGHLGYEINDSEKGEIGKLISAFNTMSAKLKNIETNRKHFISSISHELKTPLTSIRVLIDSLSLDNNNDIDTYKEYLEDIKGETERMESLVNYLMTSIKLEDISLDLKTHDIGEIIEETVKFISPYATKNNVEIYSNIIKGLKVKLDKDKFKEVLLNIIDNSIKYRDSNKSKSYIEIKLEKSKSKLFLKINDNGIGIDEKNLDKIFSHGFRILDNKKIEGYGIGMTIVKSIIDKHNWNISVKSKLGIGTEVVIEIPFI